MLSLPSMERVLKCSIVATLVFAFDPEDDFAEGLEDYMDMRPKHVNYGFHITTVEFDMRNDELDAHRLGKMVTHTFPEISYYVKI